MQGLFLGMIAPRLGTATNNYNTQVYRCQVFSIHKSIQNRSLLFKINRIAY
jgi:hypothetical protein